MSKNKHKNKINRKGRRKESKSDKYKAQNSRYQ